MAPGLSGHHALLPGARNGNVRSPTPSELLNPRSSARSIATGPGQRTGEATVRVGTRGIRACVGSGIERERGAYPSRTRRPTTRR
jgi:hypothetical protein